MGSLTQTCLLQLSKDNLRSVKINKMLLKIVFASLVLGIALSNGAPTCCRKIRVSGGRQKQWGNPTGEYFAQPGTVNGRAHYTSKAGGLAIWYDKKNWAIGLENFRGTTNVEENWNGVYLYVSSEEISMPICPYNFNVYLVTWKYRDGYVWENTEYPEEFFCEN